VSRAGGAVAQQGWIRRLFGAVLTQRRALVVAIATSVLGTLATASVPILEEHFVNTLVSRHDPGRDDWLLALVAVALVAFGLAFLRRYFGGRLALGVQHYLRTRIFAHLQRVDFAAHDQLQTGQLVSEANADVSLIQGMLAFLPRLFGNALLAVIAEVVMAVVYWPLAVVVAVSLVVIVAGSVRMRRQILPASLAAQQLKGAVNEVVEETVRGIQVVKGSALEGLQRERLERTAWQLYRARMATIWRQAKLQALLQFVPLVAEAVVIGVGGIAAIHGRLTIGAFLLFTTYLVELILPVRQLSVLVAVAQQARAGVERIYGLLDINPTIVEPSDPFVPSEVRGEIRFEGVRFAYRPGSWVLDGVDLSIGPGETVAIVGPSGSGKSSLALLLPRFYEPQEGRVVLDDVPVERWSLASLRHTVGIVFEDSFLFSDSVRENIVLGRGDVPDSEIERVARLARADEFIRALPEGYDTVVGERGVRLSGGQRQRIALARALVGDPPVLLLDDATSAVDAETEAAILQALAEVRGSRTVVLIAHRRSTLGLADRIVFMAGGKVVATGTHEELLETVPGYRRLLEGDAPELKEEPVVPPPPPCVEEPELEVPRVLDRPFASSELVVPFRFGSLFRRIRVGVILGALLVAADALLGLAAPLVLRSGIDMGVLTHRTALVLAAAGVLLGVSLLDLVVVIGEQLIAGMAAERFLFLLRSQIFQKLLALDLGYYESEMSGRIMTRMISDVDAFSNLVQQGLITALVSVVSFILVLGVVAAIAPVLALVLVVSLPPALVASIIFQRYSNRAYTLARERIAAVNANFSEQVSGVRVSRAKNRGRDAIRRFVALSRGYRDARMDAQRAISIYFPFLLLLADLTTAATLWVGGREVLAGTLAVGTVLASTLYVNQFFSPIQQLSQTFDQFQQARVAARQIRRLMGTAVTVAAPAEPIDPGRLRGEITFEGVSYRYPKAERPSLEGVSVRIRAGERVALVGATGAGKSTFAKLLVRFYDPTSGRILIDGLPLASLDLAAYRSQVAYLPQEPFLFTGSIAANVAFAQPGATPEEIAEACRSVGLGDLIAAEGIDYQIGDRGARLSAGQRQAVVLARLILQNPRIVVLDEVSSSLDPVTEARVQAALERVLAGRTTVVIAHRLSTVVGADRILVLADGRVVEEGSHRELLAGHGRYARMWQRSA
jgi:ATP-binding cassette subfamily B protein